MSKHSTEITWLRNDQDFLDNRYSRRHEVRFDGGASYAGSSSPHVVREPMSDASAIDPEEAFVASLSSCHMLWFLSLARDGGFRVDSYSDKAEGTMGRNADGQLAMTLVVLHPEVLFSGPHRPSRVELEKLHHAAHAECFIANSVKTGVRCEPVFVD